MCVPGQQPGAPASVPLSAAEALAGLEASLGYLAGAEVADWPVEALAGCLRALGRAEAVQLAAQSKVMAAFNAQAGFEGDGQATIRAWLRWQTQVTGAGAGAAAGWMKRLAVHPRVLAALAAAQVTASFARLICDASEMLAPELRDEADEILLAAVAGGATQADLVMLAQEMRERSAPPDTDGPDGAGGDEDGFTDRRVQLDVHFRGAGKLDGDLTPECTAALAALFGALGKKAGPEDTRTEGQRTHDALEEAARRLIAGGLPDTAGQPTQVQLHVTLDQLRDLPGRRGGGADLGRRPRRRRRHAGLGLQPRRRRGLRLRRPADPGGDRAPGPRARWTRSRAGTWPGSAAGLPVRGLHLPARPRRPGSPGPAGLPARAPPPARRPAARPPGRWLRPAGPLDSGARRRRRRCRRGPGAGCRTACWPTPPTSCPGRPGSPRSCAPGCSPPTSPPPRACRWTPAPRPRPSRPTCGGWSSCGTATARFPAAGRSPPTARPTT